MTPEGFTLVQPSSEPMESWQVLSQIIPHGKRKTIAYHMHISVDWVNRWCLPSETRSGQANPLDRVCQLHDAIFLMNPLGSAFVPEYLTNHRRLIVSAHAAQGFAGSEARRESAADLLEQSAAVVNSLNVQGATDHTLQLFVKLRAACDQNIERVQAELAQRGDGRTK
jgi:hypothetical protein